MPLHEASAYGEGKVITTGILQRAGKKNQNGRVYPKDILVREAKKYKDIYIKERRAIGELDHPDRSVVELKNVSHTILDLYWKGDDLFGVVQILPTPSGNILQALLNSGIRLGISSRGMGSVEKLSEDTVQVQDDFELICWDFVSNPSTHGAFMYQQREGIHESRLISEANTGGVVKIDPRIKRIQENISHIICEIGDVCECLF